MTTISDEFMRQMISTTKQYCIVILKAGPHRYEDGVEKIIWEHGRRNFTLRADGVLSIVCPISDGSDVRAYHLKTSVSSLGRRQWRILTSK